MRDFKLKCGVVVIVCVCDVDISRAKCFTMNFPKIKTKYILIALREKKKHHIHNVNTLLRSYRIFYFFVFMDLSIDFDTCVFNLSQIGMSVCCSFMTMINYWNCLCVCVVCVVTAICMCVCLMWCAEHNIVSAYFAAAANIAFGLYCARRPNISTIDKTKNKGK